MNKLLEYYNGDELSADAWKNKYALKDENEEYIEETPREMHIRLSAGLSIAEERNARKGLIPEGLSKFGRELEGNGPYIDAVTIFNYLNKFKHIIPQGSIMSALGNKYKIQSLSNCFVIPSPVDSYGGIFKTDQQIAQIEKRRGGVGLSLDTLRYEGASVLNSAGSSTGAHNFMSRFSNTTREVAQNGRRGALMLLMSVKHPDIFKFVTKKKDRTQVTGANISVMLTDKFMQAVDSEDDTFICTFPTTREVHPDRVESFGYNTIFKAEENLSIMKIHARELFNLIVENAWENAEPGVAYIDRVGECSPEGVYPQFAPIACNPCGEQWLQAYDACRLLALNYFSIVVNPYQSDAYIDYDKLYEIAYIQQRLADDIVDLEIEYVDRIIDKIKRDPEDELTKAVELDLWMNIKKTAQESRRTGCGFTALADMLAALGLKYDSDEAIKVIELVSKKKMEAELDCTIDLAILRGKFEGWNRELEKVED